MIRAFCFSKAARGFASGLLFVTLGIGGCATPLQSEKILGDAQTRYPGPVELTQVGFFPQEQYQCGPAALATVLTTAGVAVTPEALTPQVYLPAREGSLQVEIVAATRRYGRVPYVLAPQFADLLAEVNAGNPVLVLQNLGVSWWPQWHYAVVVGFDIATDEMILRSGTEARHRIPIAVFERTWQRAVYWAIVVLPPDRLPQTAEPLRYLQAIVPFEEMAKWPLAATAYETALKRWPDDLGAAMGLGNSRYALGDNAGAARAFATATQHHPTSGDAYNNLAHVLAAMGKYNEAETAIERAIAIGGSQIATYRQTAAEIRAQRARRARQR